MRPISPATLTSLTIADPSGRAAYERGKSAWLEGDDATAWSRFGDAMAEAAEREPLPPSRQLADTSTVPGWRRAEGRISPQSGDLIHYRTRWGQECNATVIGVRRFASNVTVQAYDAARHAIVSFDAFLGGFKIIALGGPGELALAREHYRAHLLTFPVWAERFAAHPAESAFGFFEAA